MGHQASIAMLYALRLFDNRVLAHPSLANSGIIDVRYSRVHFKNRRDFDGPWDVEASTMGPAAEVSVALEAGPSGQLTSCHADFGARFPHTWNTNPVQTSMCASPTEERQQISANGLLRVVV